MYRCLTRTLLLSKQLIKTQYIFQVTCTGLLLCLFWILLNFTPQFTDSQKTVTENLPVQEGLEVGSKDLRYADLNSIKDTFSKDLKYLLFWSGHDFSPNYFFEEGQRSFIKNNCSIINCYVTLNRHFFSGDMQKFDAIGFNGRSMLAKNLPKKRFPHQKYIFFQMASAENYPVCEPKFDGFFNWTATYKLTSDIPIPYLVIRNKQDDIVGPQVNMRWTHNFSEVNDALASRLRKKTVAAAWFASNCYSKRSREVLIKRLEIALKPFGHILDIYGACGMLECPDDDSSCDSLLERDYFFYLALENSFAEDYLTEKVLRALQHNTVPIVYGGADYSRFLPPDSYLDARKYSPFELAATMDLLMTSPDLYRNFFRWKSLYSYSDPSEKENVCAVCAAMNNKEMMETESVYKEFRKWWNPNFEHICKRIYETYMYL